MTTWDAELAYSHTYMRPGAEAADGSPDGAAEPLWGIYLVNAAGEDGVQAFPHSAFEWRAAENGLDPDDVATLLDVILHEGAVPSRNDALVHDDPAALAVLQETYGLPGVFTPGVADETRRQACLARIAAVKRHRLLITAAPQTDRQGALEYVGSSRIAPVDPLAPIKELTRIDPVRVAGKRAFLDWVRATSEDPARPSFFVKPPATFVGMKPNEVVT
ncbi:hypothetical protein HD597_006736 [Nonomuraea thailandensis]|uniref:Uncharacterized protein n=1 Tax=Nonomuraea thailandensis TaxID=1188745 RepID=A0A9X2GQA2_9ACTN|nr:hypothetical protein [Nonomuraea thailandensis]MCP2359716.1 hypothetical protein [Nonomuraea thailandensis]